MQEGLPFTRQRQVSTVSEIVSEVKGLLETSFRDIWVRGEISNFVVPRSGHFYFSLKDDESQLRAVCFRRQGRYLKIRPENGMEVLARGSITVYPPRGDFQMIVEYMEPLGQGALLLAFEQLKARLSGEGLFDAGRKKPLPLLPTKIGVVTSPTGAAIQDILRVLSRRNNRLDVLIHPARVQGPEAAGEIARGIRRLNLRDDLDVLIVGRGGGSAEDLWAFNEEAVARAISESRLPVVSAVGHEIDFTIADLVADLRAPTPSAAAEIVSAARSELTDRVSQLRRRAAQAIRLQLQSKRRQLHQLSSSRSFVDAETRLRIYLQRLDELQGRLLKTLPVRLQPARHEVAHLHKSLQQSIRYFLSSRRQALESRSGRLQAFSPLSVLERGYAIVSRSEGEIVRDPDQVKPGERLSVRVARGDFAVQRADDSRKEEPAGLPKR